MAIFRITGSVVGGKYIGEYEGNTPEEAIEKAWNDAGVSLCHQCSSEIDDPEVEELFAEEINDALQTKMARSKRKA